MRIVRTCRERDKRRVFHDAIMTLQFFQLTLRRFVILFTALATPTAPPTNDPRIPSSGKAPPCFTVGNIPMLFFFFVDFKPIFLLAFIIAQIAPVAVLSVSRIIRDNAFPRLLDEYIISRVSFSEIVAVRICYVVLATCSIQ